MKPRRNGTLSKLAAAIAVWVVVLLILVVVRNTIIPSEEWP